MPEFQDTPIPLDKPDIVPPTSVPQQRVRRGRPRKKVVNDAAAPKEEAIPSQISVDEISTDERVLSAEEKPENGDSERKSRDTNNRRRSTNNRRSEGRSQRSGDRRQSNSGSRQGRQQKGTQSNTSPQKVQQKQRPVIYFGDMPHWEAFASQEALDALVESASEEGKEVFDFCKIYTLALTELADFAKNLGIEVEAGKNLYRRQLFKDILNKIFEEKRPITVEGVLTFTEAGCPVLVYASDNYRIREQSTFIPKLLLNKYSLKRGHIVKAQLHPPGVRESCPAAIRILEVNGEEPEKAKEFPRFKELIPYYPLERILLEVKEPEEGWDNNSMRVIDILTPIGLGQRGLIVAPPRTGKTVLLQNIAHSIRRNHPDVHLIILLIDERPEEVTDFQRRVEGAEIVRSTFDETAEKHVEAAEMVIEKSRRMVECGKDVVILLDSITRLARAYNTTMPSSGKILSGGVEANALQLPKRFFGSARNIEEGGSLTILATALIETGSKMDEVIFEEFKGTGNMELHLDRGLVDKRIFPAISLEKSGTRKEELLYHPDEIEKIYALRRVMQGVPSLEAMEMLITRIKKTANNVEFLMNVNR